MIFRTAAAAALVIASAVLVRHWLAAPRLATTGRGVSSAAARRESPSAATVEGESAPSPLTAARELADRAPDAADAAEAPSPVAPSRGSVRGQVTRQRDGASVGEGVVAITFVPLAHSSAGDRTAWLALDEEQRAFLHEFDEAPIRPDGTFALELPAPAIVRIAVLRPKLQGSLSAQFLETEQPLGDLDLLPGRTLDLRLAVDDGACIEGRIVAAAGGFPLPGARVEIPWWSDEWSDWACVTDHDGRFRVAGIRREVAGAKSHAEAIVACDGYVRDRFLVPPAGDDLDVRGLEFALRAGVHVDVLFVASDAAPAASAYDAIAQARLLLLPADAVTAGAPFATAAWVAVAPAMRLPDDGLLCCRFNDLPPTRDVVLIGRLPDGRTLGPIALDGSGDLGPQRVTATVDAAPPLPGGSLTLRLSDADGAPLTDRDAAFTIAGQANASGRVTTDDAGRLQAPALAAGRHLTVRVGRMRTAHVVAVPRPTGSGARADAGAIELSLEPLPTSRR